MLTRHSLRNRLIAIITTSVILVIQLSATASSNRIVVFDSAMTPATFWVKIDDLDLKSGAPVKKLTLTGGKTYSGDAADKFVEATLFNFASLDTTFEEPKK